MSLRVLNHVMKWHAPSPLAKLLLIYAADGAGDDGVLRFNREAAAQFCCVSPEELRQQVADLINHGGLELHPYDGSLTIPGYEPPPPPPPGKRQLPLRVRRDVFERDGHRCVKCGASLDLSVDHIHPESKGGSHDMSNLQTLCRPCNRRKGVRVA